MTALITLLSALLDGFVPDIGMMLLRLRARLDSVVTWLVTLLAIVLTIGYQVIGRWARRAGWVD